MYKLLERVPLPNGKVTRILEITLQSDGTCAYGLESSIVGYHGVHYIFMGYHTGENLDRLNKIYKENYLNRMKQLKQIYA